VARWLHVWGALGLLVCGLARPARAEGCLDVLAWSGPDELVAPVRDALAPGPLAAAPAQSCAGIALRLSRDGDQVRVEISDARRATSHRVSDVGALASWVESWLDSGEAAAPAAPPAPPAPTAAAAAPAPAAAPAAALAPALEVERDAAAAPAAPRARAGVPVLAALRLGVDVDAVAPLWAAGGLEVAVGFGPRMWAGVTMSGSRSPQQHGTRRSALRLAARAGGRFGVLGGIFRVGGGMGIVAGSARRELDGDVVLDDEARPFLEGFSAWERRLGGRFALSLAAAARFNLPDGIGEHGPRDDIGAPAPLPDLGLCFEIGLAGHLGGPW